VVVGVLEVGELKHQTILAPGEMAPIGRALADTFRLLEPFQRSSEGPTLTV